MMLLEKCLITVIRTADISIEDDKSFLCKTTSYDVCKFHFDEQKGYISVEIHHVTSEGSI